MNMKRFLYVMVVLMMATLLSLGGIMVFSLLADRGSGNTPQETAALPIDEESMPVYAEFSAEPDDGMERVSPTTVLLFYHFQPDINEFLPIAEHPSPFLLGLNEQELTTVLPDWEILSFSREQVHLRQDPAFFTRQYIISIYGGFVAIFHDNGDDITMKELTSRPISALLPEEQQRLVEGIRVTGNDELLRALEDFGS